MTKTNPCPCKLCVPPKRKPGCHSSCVEYAEWNNEHQAKKDKLRKAKERDDIVVEYVATTTNKNMRRKNFERAKRKW